MRNLRLPILILSVIGMSLLHFFTPGHLVFYHDTYRRLSYFPIALGGIWFGVRGGIGVAVMTSIAFIPHLLVFAKKNPESYLSELTEIILYLAAGAFIGILAGRESKLREKYKLLFEKLTRSYTRLHEGTKSLIEAEEQLRVSQKLAVIGQFSASLAHEIKNPLGSIKGTAEILLDDYPEGHPKREFVDILLKETSRLDHSVNEALHLLRGQKAAGRDIQAEPLDQVMERVSVLLRNELKKKHIAFSINGQEEVKGFPVDGEKTAQIVLNLILNAMDAVRKNGRIDIRLKKDRGGVYIQVEDNGPGISPLDRESIFDPFFTTKNEGTGLGLSVSRKIAESYGGSLHLINGENGACFEIFLPGEPSGGFKATAGSAENNSLSNKRV